MTACQRIAVDAPLAGLRLHARRPLAGTPQAAKVEWLLALGAREQQRQADSTAVRTLARAVQQALAGLAPAVGKRLDEVAGLAVELGLAVAREIVGQALERGFVDPTATVARCLRDCVHGGSAADLVVRLHPDDLALVQQNLAAQPELQEEVAKARFVADRSVARGAVRAETEAGRLRYDPREALERVAAEVRREAAP
jgi:flagellar biosynthesis/type III secretory pathway protein FliH